VGVEGGAESPSAGAACEPPRHFGDELEDQSRFIFACLGAQFLSTEGVSRISLAYIIFMFRQEGPVESTPAS
jgi:hypothetical protein